MEINGKQDIAAPRAMVWDALNDPAILKKCLPGCESVERVSPEEFKVVLAAAIGPLRARFNGVLRITEAAAPVSCVMVFEGQGGAIGFGKGNSSVKLEETAGGTELSYSAKAEVGGKLAQVGSRLIDSFAKKMSDDFFNAFRKQVVPASTAAAPVTPGPTLADTSSSATSSAGSTAPARLHAQPVKPPQAQAALEQDPVHAAQPVQPAYFPQGAHVHASRLDAIVPGWWLFAAATFGAAAAIAGANFIR